MSWATLLQSYGSKHIVELSDTWYSYIFGKQQNHTISPEKAKILDEATRDAEQSTKWFSSFAELLEDLNND
jgi:hypothetical protein